MFKPIVLFLLLCSSAFAQLKVDVEPFKAITAKSARVEPLADRVAVFLTERDAGERTGAFLKITSASKWAIPFLDPYEFTASTEPGRWMMFAPVGKYRVTIIEFDPELGPKLSGVEVAIAFEKDPPIDPPPPPVGDFAALEKLADELADKLDDAVVRKALADAYKSAIETINTRSLPYNDAATAVTVARFAAFSQHPMAKDWNGVFLKPISVEVAKLTPNNDVRAYVKAITAIQSGLAK